MPTSILRCTRCETDHAPVAVGVCPRCFAPLEPVYDWEALSGRVSRESIAAGPPSIWRYGELLPVETPTEQRLAPGLTPLVPAAPARGGGRRREL